MSRPTCPNCGHHVFFIPVSQIATIYFQEGDTHSLEDVSGDVEFDDQSDATCLACNLTATLAEMNGPEEIYE